MPVYGSEPAYVVGYEQWLREWVEAEYSVCFLTFLFRNLGRSERGTLQLMEAELERFYRNLLTRVVRHPLRAASAGKLPIMVAAPDRPVHKRDGDFQLYQIRPNDGIHWHALLAIPPESRLKGLFPPHLKENTDFYRGREKHITEIDCCMVTDATGRIADYALKHVKRRTFDTNSILLLPRSLSEVREVRDGRHGHAQGIGVGRSRRLKEPNSP